MPSKADLEQELEIVSAEYDAKCAELLEAQKEITQLRGAQTALVARAKDKGVELDVLTPEQAERAELEQMKAGVEAEREALD